MVRNPFLIITCMLVFVTTGCSAPRAPSSGVEGTAFHSTLTTTSQTTPTLTLPPSVTPSPTETKTAVPTPTATITPFPPQTPTVTPTPIPPNMALAPAIVMFDPTQEDLARLVDFIALLQEKEIKPITFEQWDASNDKPVPAIMIVIRNIDWSKSWLKETTIVSQMFDALEAAQFPAMPAPFTGRTKTPYNWYRLLDLRQKLQWQPISGTEKDESLVGMSYGQMTWNLNTAIVRMSDIYHYYIEGQHNRPDIVVLPRCEVDAEVLSMVFTTGYWKAIGCGESVYYDTTTRPTYFEAVSASGSAQELFDRLMSRYAGEK